MCSLIGQVFPPTLEERPHWQRILLDGNRLYYDPTFACIIAAVIVVITFIIQTLLWIIVKVFRKLLHL